MLNGFEVLTGWLSFNRVRSALVPGRQILLALAQKYSKTLAKIITINPPAYPRPVFWRAYAHEVLFNIMFKTTLFSSIILRKHLDHGLKDSPYLTYLLHE